MEGRLKGGKGREIESGRWGKVGREREGEEGGK